MKICHTSFMKCAKMSKEAILSADFIYHKIFRAEKKLTEYKIWFKNKILGILS